MMIFFEFVSEIFVGWFVLQLVVKFYFQELLGFLIQRHVNESKWHEKRCNSIHGSM